MNIGDVVTGKITGIKPYGAFVKLEDDSAGLIHISEISSGFVKNVNSFVKVGQEVTVKVIDIDEETKQSRLSIKALNDRKRYKQRVKYTPLATKIGFETIENKMNEWIDEIEEEMKND